MHFFVYNLQSAEKLVHADKKVGDPGTRPGLDFFKLRRSHQNAVNQGLHAYIK